MKTQLLTITVIDERSNAPATIQTFRNHSDYLAAVAKAANAKGGRVHETTQTVIRISHDPNQPDMFR